MGKPVEPRPRPVTAMVNSLPVSSAGRATYMTVATAAVAPRRRLFGPNEEEEEGRTYC